MPSRVSIALIILFWLGMTGWLIEREVVPMMLAEHSPVYQVNLTDEIGSPIVNWNIWSQGQRAGTGTSTILAHDDGTYEFRSTLNLDRVNIVGLTIRRIESMYRVTEGGALEALAAKYSLKTEKLNLGLPEVVEVQGVAADGILPLRLLVDGVENKHIPLGKLDVSERRNVVNPMHMVSRLRGLRQGQTWKIALLKPPVNIPGNTAPTTLLAEVKSDILPWNGRPVSCFKIEYYDPGKEEITARTWVRKIDGLVLQQEADYLGFDITMQRVPD